jgi:hypothetical protein
MQCNRASYILTGALNVPKTSLRLINSFSGGTRRARLSADSQLQRRNIPAGPARFLALED